MPSRSKKILSPIPSTPNGEQNITEIIQQSQSIFSSSNFNEIESLCNKLIDLLIISSSTDPPNTSLRKCVVKGFSHLQENQYENVVDLCTKRLEEFFNQQGKEHRIEFLSMLNYLIENFQFGLFCVLKMKNTISDQLIQLGEQLWTDVQSTNVPHQRFTLFQQVQYYLKVLVFLLPKFSNELERDEIISKIVHQMLNDENIVTLEIRLTCSLVWHLLKENEELTPNEKLYRMKNVTNVTLSRLALYFGLIKTTMNNPSLDTNFFLQLLEEILAFKTRDATIMVGISKSFETYSEALTSSWRNIDTISLKKIVDELLRFAWDHFSYNVETVRHCSTNIYSNMFKITMNHSDLRQAIIDSQLKLLKELPWQKDGCSLSYHTLLQYLSVSDILIWNSELPHSCLMAMNDRGLASEASYLYCVLCHKHRDEEKSKDKWIDIWLKPVVQFLDTSTPLHRFLIAEYILPKILKGHPEYFEDLQKITINSRTLIVCTRIGRSLGLCPNMFSSSSSLSFIENNFIRQGITSEDEQICLDCLFILCENPKTTEYINQIEFELIQYFLQMNIDNGSTSFRNQVLSLLKKHFIRIKDSWLFCARQKLKNLDQNFDQLTERYRNYLKWLINWSCSNLYLESSYSQRHLCILILHWLIHLHDNQQVQTTSGNFKLYSFDELLNSNSLEYLINCLWDTYEDIRLYALQIIIKLNSVVNDNIEVRIERLFTRILELLSSTQPPETASGATLVQCLAQINNKKLCQLINFNENKEYDQIYLLINHIRKRLDNEVKQAKINLFQAAKNGPMYGCLSGINALLTIIQGEKYENDEEINEWRNLFSHLIEICLQIASLTGPIVSSSSPEGMMPMELTDINEKVEDENCSNQVTSQMLLVCCWRTIKEISLLFSRLGQIGIKYIQNNNQYKFINLKQVHVICNYFMEQLLKSRHCGAYELAYTGFVIICEQLWNSNCNDLCNLPIEWINNGIKMVEENTLDRNKLCLTRRSGGLPFYLQSILTDEPIKQRGEQRTHLSRLMETLLNIIENDLDTLQIDGEILENSRKIHAYNTVRSFYRNQRFANDVLPFIERGLNLSINGFTSSVWMIRNSATLLLSTIVQRIFGPSKTKDGEENLSKKNSMTSREFFNKYPSLFHLFYQQLKQITSTRSSIESLSSSCLFAILLILRRLYPSPLDGIDCSLTLDKLLPFVIKCEESPLLRIREHSSKALLALINRDQYSNIIHQQIKQLIKQSNNNIRQNTLHGRLLQLNAIFQSMKKNHLQFYFDSTLNIEQMLQSLQWCIYQNNCSLTQYSYLELLYNIHCQIPSNELINNLNKYINYIFKNADQVTIGCDDLTRILTRLIIELQNVSIQHKLFVFVEQTRTELCFIETLLLENNLSLFENHIREWITDLLLTMDLFNEQLYTKASELLLKMIDQTNNYQKLTRRIVQLIEKLRRPMSLAASFNLIGELLPLCSSSDNEEEDLIKLVYDGMNDFVDGQINDECACAILNLLSKAKSSLYNSSIAESQCQYWGLILKLSSFSSDIIREKLIKIAPFIINDKRLSGVFGANCYLTQNILFEYFTNDALFYPSSDLFINLILNLLNDLLNDIHSNDEDEEEISLDRRLWPSSEGYNNVFVSENESCDHYCACYGQHLLSSLEKLLEKSSTTTTINLNKTIEMIRDQCNRLIEIQFEAYQRFYIRQRSTIRLKLMIEFLRITKSLEGVKLEQLPQSWICDNQDKVIPLI